MEELAFDNPRRLKFMQPIYCTNFHDDKWYLGFFKSYSTMGTVYAFSTSFNDFYIDNWEIARIKAPDLIIKGRPDLIINKNPKCEQGDYILFNKFKNNGNIFESNEYKEHFSLNDIVIDKKGFKGKVSEIGCFNNNIYQFYKVVNKEFVNYYGIDGIEYSIENKDKCLSSQYVLKTNNKIRKWKG